MPLALGSFAGGVAQGIGQGQEQKARALALQLQQIQKKGKADLDAWLNATVQSGLDPKQVASAALQPQAGASQGAPAPAAPSTPGGGLAALQGAQGGPTMGGGPMTPAAAPPATAGAPGDGADPAGAVAGGASNGQPFGLQSTAPGAVPTPDKSGGSGDDMDLSPQAQAAMSKQILQTTAREIAQANPGKKWEHGELLSAVEQAIDLQDHLNPMAKLQAMAQIKGAQASLAYYKANQSDDTKRRGQDIGQEEHEEEEAGRNKRAEDNNLTHVQIAKLNNTAKEFITSLNGANRLKVAGLNVQGRIDVADLNNAARRMHDIYGGDVAEWKAQLAADASEYRTQAGGAGTDKPPPAAPPKPGTPGGKPAPDPAKLQALANQYKAAIAARKMTREQALAKLRAAGAD